MKHFIIATSVAAICFTATTAIAAGWNEWKESDDIEIGYRDCEEELDYMREVVDAKSDFRTTRREERHGTTLAVEGGYTTILIECHLTGKAKVKSIGVTARLEIILANRLRNRAFHAAREAADQ